MIPPILVRVSMFEPSESYCRQVIVSQYGMVVGMPEEK